MQFLSRWFWWFIAYTQRPFMRVYTHTDGRFCPECFDERDDLVPYDECSDHAETKR